MVWASLSTQLTVVAGGEVPPDDVHGLMQHVLPGHVQRQGDEGALVRQVAEHRLLVLGVRAQQAATQRVSACDGRQHESIRAALFKLFMFESLSCEGYHLGRSVLCPQWFVLSSSNE